MPTDPTPTPHVSWNGHGEEGASLPPATVNALVEALKDETPTCGRRCSRCSRGSTRRFPRRRSPRRARQGRRRPPAGRAVLAHSKDAGAIEALLAALKDENADVRAQAC
jgi:HEAT repeat protein